MAQVRELLSQLFATNSMGADDLNNPTSDDLNKSKVLDSMFICFPFFSQISDSRNRKDEQSASAPTPYKQQFIDLIKMCL